MKDEELRKYIQEILREDFSVDGFGDDMGTTSSGGIQGLKAIFVDPFLDVVKTGKAAVADLSSKTQVMIGGLIKSAIASVIPTVTVDWKGIRERDNQRSEAVMAKYGEVFDRTNEALWTGDGALLRFMYDPGAFITTTAIQKSPEAAIGLIDVLAGHNAEIESMTSKLKRGWDSVQGTIGMNAKRKNGGAKVLKGSGKGHGGGGGGMGGMDGGGGFGGESLSRKEARVLVEGFLDKFINWSTDRRVHQAIDSSPITKKMKKDAESLTRAHLSDVYALAKRLSEWSSTKDLDKVTDGDFQRKLMGISNEEERKKAAQHVAKNVKKSILKHIADGLRAETKFIPKGLHKIYDQAIQQIEKI